jgi:hypothetical protein
VVTLFISLTSGLFGSLLTIVTQGIQAARRLRSDEELEAGAEKMALKKLGLPTETGEQTHEKLKPDQDEQDMM